MTRRATRQWQSTGGSPRARVMAGMSLFRASTCQQRQPSFCSFVSISDQSVVAAFACVCRHDADRFIERVWASALSLGTNILSYDDHLPSFFPTPCLPTGLCASSYRQRCLYVKQFCTSLPICATHSGFLGRTNQTGYYQGRTAHVARIG
ncbi:hypothetical protein H4582DRAFT_760065 [Lactarius indigo]|nr:hypothetical protein H4582DRAFT_760065 [Lactarius indigo]